MKQPGNDTFRASLMAATLFLLACSAKKTTPADFLAAFEPTNQRIHGYAAAAAVPYVPRLNTADLDKVHAAVNQVPYRRERNHRWLAPRDFWQRGGDCEDYALAKAAELKAAGRNGLWLAVLIDGPEAHAVLVAEHAGDMITLDNREADLVPWSLTTARYTPAYVISIDTGKVYRSRQPADQGQHSFQRITVAAMRSRSAIVGAAVAAH